MQDAGCSAFQHIMNERPKIVWCSYGNSMTDDEFIYLAKAITHNQNAKRHRYYVIAAPRDSKLWKKETPTDASV
eukprot:11899112-Karenia_brevis.AAC.1